MPQRIKRKRALLDDEEGFEVGCACMLLLF